MGINLTEEEQKKLEEAKLVGYVVTHGKRLNLQNAFEEWCKVNHKPFAYIQWKIRYAVVSCSIRHINKRADFLHTEMCQLVRKYKMPLSEAGYGGGSITLRSVAPENVEECVHAMLALAQESLSSREHKNE